MRALARGLLDLVLPTACAGCGTGCAAALCPDCDRALPRLPAGGCALCDAPCAGARCLACDALASPLAGCRAAVAFEPPVVGWIRRFKYPPAGLHGLDPAPAAVLLVLIRETARRTPPPPPDLIVPVPLHAARLRARGFNPAERLARALAPASGARLAPVALERVRDTPSQTGLDRRARARNVAGAFRAPAGARLPRRVWLVDDVVTTGSTLAEAARTLRRAGAREVTAICVARTLRE